MPKNDYKIKSHSDRQNTMHGPMGGGPGSMSNNEKAKDFMGTMKQLFLYCRNYLPFIILAIILACTGSILNIIGPGKLGDITDLIQEGFVTGIDMEAVVSIASLLAVLYGLGWLFSYGQGFIMATVTQKVSRQLRTAIDKKINKLPFHYFDNTSYGDVLSRVTNDVDTIGQTLNQSLGTLVTAVTTFAGALIMMFLTNWVMAVAGILATLVGFAFMMLIMSRSQKYFTMQQQTLGSINGLVEEVYAGHTIVKAYNGENAAEKSFHALNETLYGSAWKSQFMSGLMMPVMMFVGNLGYVVVCVVGALLAVNGYIGFGVIVSFMLYIRLFTQPLSQLAQAATSLQSTAAASERVFEFLKQDELDDESEKIKVLEGVEGNVEFCNVSFGYTKENEVIHKFSTKVKSGQKIAIVGPTGAGKTTLVNLLMRFYETNSGEIRIDGVPINQLTRENVHELFCMVLQDTWLFEGTLRENIIYSKERVTDEQLDEVCMAVGLYSYVKSLPRGYDTVLGENANISAGQKQLITIARAMIENAPMLILDEATSSVDTRTELHIQKAMDALMSGRTSFVIAHRLSTIKNADLILVMKEGDIIESGNHEQLLEMNGFYAELYNSQFEIA